MSRVLLFTNNSVGARLIANSVNREIGLSAIITEGDAPLPPLQRLKGLAIQRLKGLAKWSIRLFRRERQATLPKQATLSKHVEFRERLFIESAARRLLREAGRSGRCWPRNVVHFYVRSINDPDFVDWCRKQDPDLILVYGTHILHAPIIRIPRLGALNVHSSLLPDYRGTRSEFWQVLNGDLDKSGVTIHFIDEGVDTGDIVLQDAANPRSDVDPYMLRTMNTIIAAHLLPRAASLVLKGSAVRLRQASPSTPTFRAKDITLERRMELLQKLTPK